MEKVSWEYVSNKFEQLELTSEISITYDFDSDISH